MTLNAALQLGASALLLAGALLPRLRMLHAWLSPVRQQPNPSVTAARGSSRQ